MAEISDIVRVTASIRARGVLRKELGRTLFVTLDGGLSAVGGDKVRAYRNFDGVAADFNANSEVYKAAQIYFAQIPFPRNFMVGRWNKDDSPTVIYGGAPEALGDLTAVSDGSFSLAGSDFAALDLSGRGDLAAVAQALQDELRTGGGNFANATVVYTASPSRFTVSLPARPALDAPFVEHSTGTGTDIGGLLGLDAASGARIVTGAAAETLSDAMDAMTEVDNSFYFVVLEKSQNDTATVQELSAWAGANDVMFSAESNAGAVLNADETTSVAAMVGALESPRTFVTWSATADYKALSIAARLSSVNFASPGSIITTKFKQLPGTKPDEVSASQKAELDRKRINLYTTYGDFSMFEEGVTLQPGTWIDVRYWLDWFVGAIRTDVFNLLASSPRVPQTNAGIATIVDVIESVCRQGVANGGIAPGVVTAGMAADIRQATGDDEFDGVLTNGYMIFVTPLAAQPQADREARKSPPFRVWVKGSGAVHFVDIDITFEN